MYFDGVDSGTDWLRQPVVAIRRGSRRGAIEKARLSTVVSTIRLSYSRRPQHPTALVVGGVKETWGHCRDRSSQIR